MHTAKKSYHKVHDLLNKKGIMVYNFPMSQDPFLHLAIHIRTAVKLVTFHLVSKHWNWLLFNCIYKLLVRKSARWRCVPASCSLFLSFHYIFELRCIIFIFNVSYRWWSKRGILKYDYWELRWCQRRKSNKE